MRHFATTGLRLWNLSREAKLVYTFFCAFSLLAMVSSILLYEDLVGPSLRAGQLGRVGRYYGGTAQAPLAEAPPKAATAGGPEIALGEDAEPSLTVAMPYRKLLEITHFHLFTVPVFLLIISHLFMLSALSSRARLFWIALGWGSATLHVGAPWLIRAAGTGLSFVFPLSGAALFVSCTVLSIYPAVGMWRRPRAQPAAGAVTS